MSDEMVKIAKSIMTENIYKASPIEERQRRQRQAMTGGAVVAGIGAGAAGVGYARSAHGQKAIQGARSYVSQAATRARQGASSAAQRAGKATVSGAQRAGKATVSGANRAGERGGRAVGNALQRGGKAVGTAATRAGQSIGQHGFIGAGTRGARAARQGVSQGVRQGARAAVGAFRPQVSMTRPRTGFTVMTPGGGLATPIGWSERPSPARQAAGRVKRAGRKGVRRVARFVLSRGR